MRIEVIGRGNVGSQFARIFGVTPIPPRTLEGLSRDADLYIIAVSDAAVAEVAGKMPPVNGIVVHTTGSVPMEVLRSVACKGRGVFYPFQTISSRRQLEARRIPLLIEADNGKTLDFLKKVAEEFGFGKIEEADSGRRRKIHLSAVFACNFTNALIGIGCKILSEAGIEPDIISPLVEETFEKLKAMPAKEAQTGPAVRKDYPTMEKHLELLRQLNMEDEAEIYTDISDYIINSTFASES